MLLLQLCGECTKFGRAHSFDHRGVILAQFQELAAQALLLGTSTWVGTLEERACGNAACEPFSAGQASNNGAKDVLNLIVIKRVANKSERFGGLLTHNGLVVLGELFKEWQEDGLILEKDKALAELLSDSEKDFIILFLSQG